MHAYTLVWVTTFVDQSPVGYSRDWNKYGYRTVRETWALDERGMLLLASVSKWVPYSQVVAC